MKHTSKFPLYALPLFLLYGCGAGEEPATGAAMSAIGSGVTAPASMENIVDGGAVLPTDVAVEDTKSLIVADDFAFDTAQHIDIDFDLESARGTEASVSICTAFDQETQGYDIDYDSCTVKGIMNDGLFTHSMDVTNEFDSVVAVVWFQDESIPPVYREFSVRDRAADRTTKTAGESKVIVWR